MRPSENLIPVRTGLMNAGGDLSNDVTPVLDVDEDSRTSVVASAVLASPFTPGRSMGLCTEEPYERHGKIKRGSMISKVLIVNRVGQ